MAATAACVTTSRACGACSSGDRSALSSSRIRITTTSRAAIEKVAARASFPATVDSADSKVRGKPRDNPLANRRQALRRSTADRAAGSGTAARGGHPDWNPPAAPATAVLSGAHNPFRSKGMKRRSRPLSSFMRGQKHEHAEAVLLSLHSVRPPCSKGPQQRRRGTPTCALESCAIRTARHVRRPRGIKGEA